MCRYEKAQLMLYIYPVDPNLFDKRRQIRFQRGLCGAYRATAVSKQRSHFLRVRLNAIIQLLYIEVGKLCRGHFNFTYLKTYEIYCFRQIFGVLLIIISYNFSTVSSFNVFFIAQFTSSYEILETEKGSKHQSVIRN